MDISFTFLFAIFIGFGHAFEADHLVAVSSIISKRDNVYLAIKDGIYWGLGHSSTILMIGILVIFGKVFVPESFFSHLEAGVGLMLIVLGSYRLYELYQIDHTHKHLAGEKHSHAGSYGVGMVHGLAGSGAMVLFVMTQVKGSFPSLFYLFFFGMGSIFGMLVSALLIAIPFSKSFSSNSFLKLLLIWLSSLLCMVLGTRIIYENLWMNS